MRSIRIAYLIATFALSIFFRAAILAQSAPPPAFEAASIKLADPNLAAKSFPVRGGPGTSDPGRVTYTNVSLRDMLYWAYSAGPDRIVGPAWLASGRFDIVATMPSETTKEQFTSMLRNLLAERFHLALHHESKEVQGYDLVTGKNGPKLTKSPEADVAAARQPVSGAPLPNILDSKGYMRLDRPGMIYPFLEGSDGKAIHLIARAQTIPDLAKILSGFLHRSILDKTNLTGRYDFTLDFALEKAESADAPDLSAAGIPTAIQDQLGLKLEPAKVSVDTLIVDRADKIPAEN